MEEQSKINSMWQVAFIHWLVAGFLIPFVVFSLASLLWRSLGLSFITAEIIDVALALLVLWLGVRFSISQMVRKYSGINLVEIAKLSLVYVIVVSGGARIYSLFYTTSFDLMLAINWVGFVLSTITFYLATRKGYRVSIQ